MANHLLIGLGGTGGKILRAMRKRIYEEFGTNEPDIDTHISYIYVDSDLKDLNDDASWNYMGNPVYLSPSEGKYSWYWRWSASELERLPRN